MKIQNETNNIREEIKRGAVIDLQNRLYFLDSVNSEKNREVRGKLEVALYKEGYLPYFNEVSINNSKARSKEVRAFYAIVDESCKLYISINPTTNNYELKYIVYNEVFSERSISKIILRLKELNMLITFIEKAS